MRPEPIIPQNRIIGIQERIDNLGNVIVPMSDEEVRNKVQKLVDEGGRGFVVVTLNAFINSLGIYNTPFSMGSTPTYPNQRSEDYKPRYRPPGTK